jgi:sulfur-oxidizing protein SoxX
MKETPTKTLAIVALAIALFICISWMLASKIPTENSPSGFILPPGDPIAGQRTFAELNCIQCHTVAGANLPEPDSGRISPSVQLGGTLLKVKTYGQLVTAIIHPSESILEARERYVDAAGNSLMPNYRQAMTVQQMTDLVAFLQEHYDIAKPAYDPQGIGYPYY